MDNKAAEFAQKLGSRIVQLRREHNYAQERLATLARMNKGYLSSVESGQRVPSVGMLMKLAKVLEVSVFELFVFPEQGAAERLWEEIRLGQTSQAEQLRARHGLGAAIVPAGEERPARPVRRTRATQPVRRAKATAKPLTKARVTRKTAAVRKPRKATAARTAKRRAR